MRHARTERQGTRSAVRSILTAALLLCVLSGALPAEAVLNTQDSMPCCRGQKGLGGECHGNSCPMHPRARSKTAARVKRDPVCGAGRALRATAVKTPLTARLTSTQESAGAASFTKPCPSECCGTAAASFTNLRRQRQEAALNDSLRTRPNTSELQGHTSSASIKIKSALRRLHPPRAPPNVLNTGIA